MLINSNITNFKNLHQTAFADSFKNNSPDYVCWIYLWDRPIHREQQPRTVDLLVKLWWLADMHCHGNFALCILFPFFHCNLSISLHYQMDLQKRWQILKIKMTFRKKKDFYFFTTTNIAKFSNSKWQRFFLPLALPPL